VVYLRADRWSACASVEPRRSNRQESLQLLRIQDDLNQLPLAMRDMLDSTEPYPLSHGRHNSNASAATLDTP
jgi:hypothetical protein